MPLKYHIQRDLSGGLNDATDRHQVAAHEAIAALNCLWDGSALTRRAGTVLYGTAPMSSWGAYPFTGIFRAYCDQSGTGQLSKALIGLINGQIYYGTDATGAKTSIGTHGTTITAGNRMRCVQWGDSRIYLAVGGTGAVDGDHALRWGLATAAGTDQRECMHMGAAALGGTVTGSMSTTVEGTQPIGWYRYGVTITYGPDGSWGESLPTYSVAYNHTDATKRYRVVFPALTGTPLTTNGAYQRKVYRSEVQSTEADANLAPLFYLCTITTAADTYKEYAETGANTILIDVQDPAPTTGDTGDLPGSNATMFAVHNGRLYGVFAGKGDRCYYSNIDVPDEWPENNRVEVNGAITGIQSAPFGFAIFTTHGVTVIEGQGLTDPSSAARPIRGAPGCTCPDSIATIIYKGQPVVVYANEKGIYFTDGQGAYLLGATEDQTANKCGHTWQVHCSAAGAKANAQGIYWQGDYLLAYQDDRETGKAYNNRVLRFNPRDDSWWIFNGWNVGCWAIWNGSTDQDELYFGTSDSTGFIYRAFVGYESCELDWQGGDWPVGGELYTKQFRKGVIECDHDTLPVNLYAYGNRGLFSGGPYAAAAPAAGSEENRVLVNLEAGIKGERCSIRINKTDALAKTITGVGVGYIIQGAGGV